jgi:hypothetical protein
MRMKNDPPPDIFDESLAKALIGKSLLIGITHTDSTGAVQRSQIFGTVTVAERKRESAFKTGKQAKRSGFRQTLEVSSLHRRANTQSRHR